MERKGIGLGRPEDILYSVNNNYDNNYGCERRRKSAYTGYFHQTPR